MLSVMLVDDEPIIRRGMKKLVDWEALGYSITCEAGDGDDALELARSQQLDLVITDLKMPVMDGLVLSNKLKTEYPSIKVIILTGYDDFEWIQTSIRNGVADYLLKPISEEHLKQSLTRLKLQMEEERYRYALELEDAVTEAVEAGDKAIVIQAIHDLFKEFRIYRVPQVMILRICQRVLLLLNRLVEQNGSNLNDIIRQNVLEDSYLVDKDCQAEMLRIAIQLCDHRSGYKSRRAIQAVTDYLDHNFQQEISLRELAAKFYFNPSYLSQLFRNERNETYSGYLMKIRMDKAKKLMADPNLKIQDISELVGYSNPKYFGQQFKKVTGSLPSEYRYRHDRK